MDEATYKILDILARNLGNPLSIHELTGKIEEIHGGAYYANMHEKIHDLSLEGIITLSKSGRSSLTSLNFQNYLVIDLLAEMELKRKQDFLRGRQELQMLVMETDSYFHPLPLIRSIIMINPEKNARLNRAGFIIQIRKSDDRMLIEETAIAIHLIIESLQGIHNIKIDYLIMEDHIFLDLLKSNEANPIRDMMHNKIVILNPQYFWSEIKNAIEKGTKITAEEAETNPAKISEEDVVYNLARFGYTEIGPKIKQGKTICIEYIITSIFFHNDARRIGAIPIILAKNIGRTNYYLLLFLARKYSFGGKILGILKTMRNLIAHGDLLGEPIRLLEAMRVEETKANQKSMKEKLRLYNVT